MTELRNETRNLLQATYTPIKTRPEVRDRTPLYRTWDKWSFIAALKFTHTELVQLQRRIAANQPGENNPDAELRKQALEALKIIAATLPDIGSQQAIRGAALFKEIRDEVLSFIAQALIQLRKEAVQSIENSYATIAAAYHKATTVPAKEPKPVKLTDKWKRRSDVVVAELPNASVFQFEHLEKIGTREQPDGITQGEKVDIGILAQPSAEKAGAGIIKPTFEPKINNLFEWAVDHNISKPQAMQAMRFLESSSLNSLELSHADFTPYLHAYIDQLNDLVSGFEQRLLIEPIGFLHLEKLSFIPAGIERGELVYSLPLAPAEEAHLTHKEWSNTSEEFEKIVTDYLEDFSEEGVTEKRELTQSTNSENQHSSGFNTGVTASGGYGPVNITVSANYNVADSSSRSEQYSRNQSSETTRKASSRAKKEHKMSFKMASAAGTEDQQVRKIVNPFPDRATRVDYYQLVRKWHVELYRYGIRLTYDLTVPEPGVDILSKIKEIKDITSALAQGFAAPNATLPWARFDLKPGDITRHNYTGLAAQYNTVVEPPPTESISIFKADTQHWTKDEIKHHKYVTFEIDVPQDYQVTNVSSSYGYWFYTGESWSFTVNTNTTSWLGKSGHFPVVVGAKFISSYFIEVRVTATLRDSSYSAWKLKVWAAMRDAAEMRYNENRQLLEQRLGELNQELGADDALSLRKMEREEVMKAVLRWMFGPNFQFTPSGIPDDLYGPNETVISEQTWAKVLAHGEIIKFLHHAIEWENMLYFLYPYFWTHTSKWEFKKYLEHPDPMHKVFLRSGSARVVLTVRQGFEKSFVTFLETGDLSAILPDEHPYLKITEEMENYAKTNYPGIPPANPVENARPLLYPRQRKAWDEMQILFRLLDAFYKANNRYPTTAEGLGALQAFTSDEIPSVPLQDPWGNDYVYTSPGVYGPYDLVSLGADGVAGGTDEDADINSWADASLIGSWFEYTPTSALDISFDETMPSA